MEDEEEDSSAASHNNPNHPTPTFCGAEHFLVGLSPSYWSHIPMAIADVLHLKVVEGVTCMLRKKSRESSIQPTLHAASSATTTTEANRPNLHCIPVAKCALVGIIVCAEPKASHNSYSYALDDGTGMIDCLAWGHSSSDGGVYSLPALATTDGGTLQTRNSAMFGVGDLVRVLGRLECISISHDEQQPQRQQQPCTGPTVSPKVRKAIYEVHVTRMELLVHRGGGGGQRYATMRHHGGSDLDWEANHWVKSVVSTSPTKSKNQRPTIHSSQDVLEWLGPTIQSDVLHRRNFPSAKDERTGAWKVFGASCTCNHNNNNGDPQKWLTYKDELLYCHCQATTDPLDPNLVYRDALLHRLVDLEEKHRRNQEREEKNHISTTSTTTTTTSHNNVDYRFHYHTISKCKELIEVANQVTATTKLPGINAEKLVVVTLRALRQDGIIALLDQSSDTYLLISRRGVLVPYLHRLQGKKQRKGRGLPFYLQSVPKSRLDYLRRQMRQSTATGANN